MLSSSDVHLVVVSEGEGRGGGGLGPGDVPHHPVGNVDGRLLETSTALPRRSVSLTLELNTTLPHLEWARCTDHTAWPRNTSQDLN